MAKKKEILLGVTGSIAAYKACDIINKLRASNFNVTPVMTKEAGHFITPLTLQNLAGNKVVGDMFAIPDNFDPLHTSLAEKADLILIAPATANIIAKLANGICDCLLSSTVLATKAPVLIAPAMNDNMYNHKAVKENIARLKGFGYKFVGPVSGRLVCGYRGMGHIAGVDTIVSHVKGALKTK